MPGRVYIRGQRDDAGAGDGDVCGGGVRVLGLLLGLDARALLCLQQAQAGRKASGDPRGDGGEEEARGCRHPLPEERPEYVALAGASAHRLLCLRLADVVT
jgi:hypothetical protein